MLAQQNNLAPDISIKDVWRELYDGLIACYKSLTALSLGGGNIPVTWRLFFWLKSPSFESPLCFVSFGSFALLLGLSLCSLLVSLNQIYNFVKCGGVLEYIVRYPKKYCSSHIFLILVCINLCRQTEINNK